MDVQPTAVVLLQPLVFLLQPPKVAPVVPPATASCGRLCCRRGLTTPTTPTADQAIPLLTHTPCYSAHRSRTSEPSYSSLHGHPLPCLPRLRVVPFLGLAVIHRPGALGVAWSTSSRNDFIGHGLYVERLTAGSTAALRKCLLITCKIIIPPPDSGTHRTGHCISPPDC